MVMEARRGEDEGAVVDALLWRPDSLPEAVPSPGSGVVQCPATDIASIGRSVRPELVLTMTGETDGRRTEVGLRRGQRFSRTRRASSQPASSSNDSVIASVSPLSFFFSTRRRMSVDEASRLPAGCVTLSMSAGFQRMSIGYSACGSVL